jgi:hypothetical protein
MVRLRAFAFALTVLVLPSPGLARKPLSAALLSPALRPTTALRLDLPVVHSTGCRTCGSGIPDARIGHNLLLGADSGMDRLRLYVKHDLRQVTVDVSTNSALVGYGFRF